MSAAEVGFDMARPTLLAGNLLNDSRIVQVRARVLGSGLRVQGLGLLLALVSMRPCVRAGLYTSCRCTTLPSLCGGLGLGSRV